jgi:glutathione S-transferase
MSYCLKAYAVNRLPLQKFYGLNHPPSFEIFKQKMQGLLDQIQSLYEDLDFQPDESQDVNDYLWDIFQGHLRWPEQAEAYAHAYEALCAYVGESLASGDFARISTSQIADLNLAPHCFLPLPQPKNFPLVYSLGQEQFADLQAYWQALPWDEEEEAQQQLLHWLEQAQSLRRDLVLFIYFD